MHTSPSTAHQDRLAYPVSASWAPAYDRPSDVSALPEQFFDFGVSLARVGPETALLYAVLEDAFLCFQKQFEVRMRPIQRRAAREAEEWFFSDDTRELFSFLSVCTALGLEPEFIRKKLKQCTQA
jgi:hypothetical protein